MKTNLTILFCILTVTSVFSRYTENDKKNSEILQSDACKEIHQNASQDIINQMKMAEGIKIEKFDTMFIFKSGDNFEDKVKTLQYLTNYSRIPPSLKEDIGENYLRNRTLSMANENIFLYTANRGNKKIGYCVHPKIIGTKNEVFIKYFVHRLLEKSLNIKVIMDTKLTLRTITSINEIYNSFFKNSTKDDVRFMNNWSTVFLNHTSKTGKSFINLNFTNELRLSEGMKCSVINMSNDFMGKFHFLSDTLSGHYVNLEENSTDVNLLIKELNKSYEILKKAVEETPSVIDTGRILDVKTFNSLESTFRLLQIDISRDIFIRITNTVNQINFLRMVTGEHKNLNFLIEPVRSILEIEASAIWYKELQKAYVSASRCVSSNHLLDVMKPKIEDLSKHLGFKTLNSNMKGKQLERLEHHSFNRDITKECVLMIKAKNEYKLQIHGDFLSFRDIPDVEICNGRTRYIELFARDVLRVDWDLIRVGEVVQIVAIAPKWIISGERKIDLTGAPGEDHEIQFAEDGQLGVRGEDGLPGLPGGPGGIFFGVAEEIVNKDSLQILADGGLGGAGQHGGEGGKALEPRVPSMDDYDHCLLRSTWEGKIFFGFQGFDETCIVYNFDLLTITTGGNGGNGGKGGNGGNPGKVFLVRLNGTFEESAPGYGRMGANGLGGKGGLGNYKNKTIEEKCRTELNDTVGCEGCELAVRLGSVLRNGTVGHDGGNTEGLKSPAEFKELRSLPFVVNDYKNYIRPYLSDPKNGVLRAFYAKLMENEVVNKQYGTFGLLDELKGLERQNANLTESVDLLPMYKNVQKRIEDYAKNRKDGERGKDYVVALGYAYIAALSRSSRLIETDYFVSHLGNYVMSVSKNLDVLKDDIVQYSANQLSEDYKQNIERKIREAQIIIESQLRNEVNRLNKVMKNKVYDLINETVEFKNESKENNEALKSAMLQHSIFMLVKCVLVGISALIPGGQAAAIVAFTAIQVGETFAPEYPKEQFRRKIPVAVGNRFAGALDFVKNSKREHLKLLGQNIEFLEKQEEGLDGASKYVNRVTSDSTANKTDVQNKIRNLDDKIKKLIQTEKGEDDQDGFSFSKVFEAFGKLKALYALKEKNSDAVEGIESKAEESETLKNGLDLIEKDTKKLQDYEGRIYNELIPVFEKMRQDLPSDETLSVQSVAALDVSKWKVQLSLKKVKLIVKEFTEGFKVADEMSLIIESLEDTMNTLINVYDQIQNFQQEKKLAAYIKQLSNAKFRNFYSSNEELQNSVLEIRSIIRGNLALIQYEKVFKAFKQLVFPFANKYMKDLHKPSVFEISALSEKDFCIWLTDISETVLKIKNKIDEIEATLFKSSKFNERLEYGNKHQGEFYLWENETHNEMISNLLDGKEVILSPDARNFPHYAVKFKKIRIGFIAKNKEDQNHLTELLNTLEMKMTHEGNSYYTCGNKMYLISHSPITLIKTFNESYGGELDTVQKLASGDDLVSPFATWRVQIRKATGGIEKNYFVDFKNKVDLVLEGIGSYVQVTENDVCNEYTSLSEYYEEYVPIV